MASSTAEPGAAADGPPADVLSILEQARRQFLALVEHIRPELLRYCARMLGGWLMFSYVPDAASLFGMGLIAVCGAAGAWLTVRERREPIEPAES